MNRKPFLILALLLGFQCLWANNARITNLSYDIATHRIRFDLAWDNGWRLPTTTPPGNMDGVWVFFKWKNPSTGRWQHLTFADMYLPAGYDSEVNGYGGLIFPTANHTGNVSIVGIEVRADFGYNMLELSAFAVEMVSIVPNSANPFVQFGDGNGSNISENAFRNVGNFPTFIDSFSGGLVTTSINDFDDSVLELPNAIIVTQANTISTLTSVLNDAFPTSGSPLGFGSADYNWYMKYEISQAAYRDFLNTLTYNQQTTRTAVTPSSPTGTLALAEPGFEYGNWLQIATPGVAATSTPAIYGCNANDNNTFNEANDGEWRACNWLSWPDVAAWLDWAALRPMSELEYEVLCRGWGHYAVFGQYPWGHSTIAESILTPVNDGAENEYFSNASSDSGNAIHQNTYPDGSYLARNGEFANASSNIATAGASYYGAMELAGNVNEVCVTVGNVAGRSFRIMPTDGVLDNQGNANQRSWPGKNGNINPDVSNGLSIPTDGPITGNAGTIMRGGSFGSGSAELRVSTRSQGAMSVTRQPYNGGRGCTNF